MKRRNNKISKEVIMYLEARFCMFCGGKLVEDDLVEGCCTKCMEKAASLNMWDKRKGRRTKTV
jgi:reverse gyrase